MSKGWLAVRSAVTFGLLALIANNIDIAGLGARFRALDFATAGMAVGLLMLQLWVAAYRWHLVANVYAPPVPVRILARFCFVAQFFSQLLPSTVGGDVIRTWLFQRQGSGLRPALLSILADRLFGVCALMLLVGLALTLPAAARIDPGARISILVLVTMGAGALVGLILCGFLPAAWFAHNRITRLLRDLTLGLRRLLSAGHRTWALAAVSLSIHAASIVGIWLISRAVGLSVGIGVLLVTVPIALIAAMVPISIGGWGVREGVLVTLLAIYDVARDGALAMSLLFGVALALASLPGAVLWLTTRFQSAEAAAAVQDAFHSY